MTIIYVENQEKTKMFFQLLLNKHPMLDVPGITEFELLDGSILGIMPDTRLGKLFSDRFEKKDKKKSLPHIEFYFISNNADTLHKRALELGATEIREFSNMDWGHRVAYSINHDGHIFAFAEEI